MEHQHTTSFKLRDEDRGHHHRKGSINADENISLEIHVTGELVLYTTPKLLCTAKPPRGVRTWKRLHLMGGADDYESQQIWSRTDLLESQVEADHGKRSG